MDCAFGGRGDDVDYLTGVQSGRRAQNLLTGSKLAGFAMVVLAGALVAIQHGWPPLSAPLPEGQSAQPGFALIFILFAFGGWNDSVYIAAEMREPQKSLPRALAGGVAAVLLVYLLVNLAYSVLGIEQLRTLSVPAREVAARGFGPAGGLLVSALMIISALGAMHGTIFGGTRWPSRWARSTGRCAGSATGQSPEPPPAESGWSDSSQCSWSAPWKRSWDAGHRLSCAPSGAREGIPWDFYGGGFATLLASTTPLFWVFFLLAGAAQIVLRIREPQNTRPFRTPLYRCLR